MSSCPKALYTVESLSIRQLCQLTRCTSVQLHALLTLSNYFTAAVCCVPVQAALTAAGVWSDTWQSCTA
jgi:hypothetical protein